MSRWVQPSVYIVCTVLTSSILGSLLSYSLYQTDMAKAIALQRFITYTYANRQISGLLKKVDVGAKKVLLEVPDPYLRGSTLSLSIHYTDNTLKFVHRGSVGMLNPVSINDLQPAQGMYATISFRPDASLSADWISIFCRTDTCTL